MITPANGMPFDVHQTMAATKYDGNSAVNNFPNSEHVKPPLDKEKKRVVEASTRTQVSIDLLEKWLAKKETAQKEIENLQLQQYFKKEEIVQGALLDIEI